MNSHLIIKLTVLVFSYFLLLPDVVAQEEPSKLDIATAEYKLKGIERSAKLANGAPFSLGKDGTIALEKIAALYKAFPDHPKVKELFDRARTVVKASKGDFIEITIERKPMKTVRRCHERLPNFGVLSKTSSQKTKSLARYFPHLLLRMYYSMISSGNMYS